MKPPKKIFSIKGLRRKFFLFCQVFFLYLLKKRRRGMLSHTPNSNDNFLNLMTLQGDGSFVSPGEQGDGSFVSPVSKLHRILSPLCEQGDGSFVSPVSKLHRILPPLYFLTPSILPSSSVTYFPFVISRITYSLDHRSFTTAHFPIGISNGP